MKTTISAIRLIYNFLIGANVKQLTSITGDLYWLNRPKDSKLEDIVVNSIAMNAEALQEGVFNINVHVPNLDLANDNTQPDMARFEDICLIIVALVEDVWGTDYNFKVENPGSPVPDGNNWFCNIRIRFWTLR